MTIPLALDAAAEVTVVIYDVLGRQVAVLHNGPLAAGRHALALASTDLPPGAYVVRAAGVGISATRRFTVGR